MSLIKEALDKAQEEGKEPGEPGPDPEQLPDDPAEPGDASNSSGIEVTLGTVLASVVIVVLAALIGAQIVLLAAMFLF